MESSLAAFEPSQEDIFVTISTGEYQRLIFASPQELNEEEQAKYRLFLNILDGEGLRLPEEYLTDEKHAYRFLQGLRFQHKAAYDAIIQH